MLASELTNKMKIKLNGKGRYLKIKMVWKHTDQVFVYTSKGSTQFNANDVVDSDTKSTVLVERTNLMTGKTYMEERDTPRCCSPASELYWSC